MIFLMKNYQGMWNGGCVQSGPPCGDTLGQATTFGQLESSKIMAVQKVVLCATASLAFHETAVRLSVPYVLR